MFFYTLPIIFSVTEIIQPLELLGILLASFGIFAISSPLPNLTWQGQAFSTYTLYQFLFQSWVGNISLWQVFWPFFLLLNIILFTADTLVKAMILSVSSWDDVHMIILIPVVWWSTSVWHCTANSKKKLLGAGARLAVFCVVFELIIRFIIRKDYPRVFLNCQELLIDLNYSSCF